MSHVVHNLVRGGMDTRRRMLAREIDDQERRLTQSCLFPTRRLHDQAAQQQYNLRLAQLYSEQEARLHFARPVEVARSFERLGLTDFVTYLSGFTLGSVIGRAGLVEHCVLAHFYRGLVTATGCKIEVWSDHLIVHDGWDEALLMLPEWAACIAAATTPPHACADYGAPITVLLLRKALALK